MRGSTTGLPDDFQGFNTKYYQLLTILDSLFSTFIICPCVVGYWRSVWILMDIYVLPTNLLLSSVISIGTGISGHIFFSIFQNLFEDNFHPDKNRILYYLISRLYTVCFAFTCVNGWRGPWYILDLHSKSSVLTSTMVGVVALVSIRGLRNVSASPCIIVNDGIKGYFGVVTMFRISVEGKTSLYILDCLFSVLIVGTLVVFVWRGAWILTDILMFPEDDIWSAWGSLVMGYAVVGVAFLLQPLMKFLCDKLVGAPRLLLADIFVIIAFLGTVNVWRGIWNLLNLYFLPDNLELSCWITHWICLIILILLGCSNSLLVRGVYIDAEEPAGKCVIFPCYYLRVIFQEDKLKKLQLTNLNFDGSFNINNKKKHTGDNNRQLISSTSINLNKKGNYMATRI